MKLIKQTKENTEVRVHNDIASGRGDFSACMLDVLFYILSDFKKDERFYTIRVKDISELTGREWKYQQFREATAAMGSRMFEIETGTSLLQLWLFSSVEYLKGTGSLEVELSKKAMPYLEDLKKNFTSMQLKSLLSCSSKYAKRLYMLGCQWRGAGKVPMMTIDELKMMLGLKDPKGQKVEKYKQFSDFKKVVLDVAKAQINEHTDITIEYNLLKQGRSYHWIEILINYNAIDVLKIDFKKPIEIQKTTKTIMNYGFSEKQAVAIAKVGMKEFEKYRDKVLAKIRTREMEMDAIVPYIVKVYQNKGVLIKLDQ